MKFKGILATYTFIPFFSIYLCHPSADNCETILLSNFNVASKLVLHFPLYFFLKLNYSQELC